MMQDHPLTEVHLVATFPDRGSAQRAFDVIVREGGMAPGRTALLTPDQTGVAGPVAGRRAARRRRAGTKDEVHELSKQLGRSTAKGALIGLLAGSVLGLLKGVTIGGSLGVASYDPLGPLIGVVVGAAFGALAGGLHLGYGRTRSLVARDVLKDAGPVAVVLHGDDDDAERLVALVRRTGPVRMLLFDRNWALLRRPSLRPRRRERPPGAAAV